MVTRRRRRGFAAVNIIHSTRVVTGKKKNFKKYGARVRYNGIYYGAVLLLFFRYFSLFFAYDRACSVPNTLHTRTFFQFDSRPVS